MLVLWVTDNPVHKNLERLRASGYDVLMTQVCLRESVRLRALFERPHTDIC
jgi:hypothetical protein